MKRIHVIMTLLLLILPNVSAQERIVIRWYIGLGASANIPFEAYQAIADEFNTSQDEIQLVLDYVDNEAYEVLEAYIENFAVPDIVGPVATNLRVRFPGHWLDLNPYIEANAYDLRDFDPALVNYYNVEGAGQLSIPFTVYPSFIMYNKNIFDAAGIPYPPRAYGEPYIDWNGYEREWNIETLREIAIHLSRDANGLNPTMQGFDPEKLVQFGFGNQYTELRGRDVLFGSGSFVDANGNASIPENWRAAEQWYHQAMWEDYFYPNHHYAFSEVLNEGNWFASGNIAMVNIHSWYLGWGTADLEASWDFAPVPSYQGRTTAKIHEDSFLIWKGSPHPQQAFTVLAYLMAEQAEALSQLYHALPARRSLQNLDAFITSLSEEYPETDWASLNWELVLAGISYAENPAHDGEMPDYYYSTLRCSEYLQTVDTQQDADVDTELDLLENDLQAIFDDGR